MKQARQFPDGRSEKPGNRHAGQPVVLSPRQRQILTLLRDGKSNKEIAAELDIGIGTVKQHLVTLFKKMGVNNRAMAIAKSFSVDGLSIDGPVPLETDVETITTSATMIERRPCAVLSLELITHVDDSELSRILYRVFAETAYDFGAVFLSRLGGRCDMIFGIRRVRRHDVLRAIRAAVAISEEVLARTGAIQQIRAGLAYGYILASIDQRGEWTGEAISGKVVSAAQDVLVDSDAGTVALHPSAARMIAALHLETEGGIPTSVDLDRKFRWHRTPHIHRMPPLNLRDPLDRLSKHLRKLDGDGANILVEGEGGMGKTTLVAEFANLATTRGFETETWVCATPDSQPGSVSLGRIERLESDQTLDASDILKRVSQSKSKVLVVEDCHLLPRAELEHLMEHMAARISGKIIVLSYRGRVPKSRADDVFDERLHLAHLPPDQVDALLMQLLGRNHPAQDWISEMAHGVPGFLVRLAALTGNAAHWVRHGPGEVPPADLFAQIAERVEARGLDRRLLHAVAVKKEATPHDDLRKTWHGGDDAFEAAVTLALKSGLLRQRPGRRGKEPAYDIAHPLVKWVAAAAFPPQNGTFD